MALEVRGLTKAFGSKVAVRDLSFTVEEGQVFGLLGLNGAGKSTTIRMILDILTPDSGEILWRGKPTQGQIRANFGYLPEERGLYQKMKVIQHLVLFGRLQGYTKAAALEAAETWLERFRITEYRDKVVADLSKGNQQKVQFIAAVLHKPQVMILDEPFSGLDPVNTSLFKDVFRELARDGRTIIFSSHQLDHVEELSDAVGMIHQSELVLQGSVESILQSQAPREIRIRADESEVRRHIEADVPVQPERGGYLSIPIHVCDPDALLQRLVSAGVAVSHFELVRPTLNDVFLEKVGQAG